MLEKLEDLENRVSSLVDLLGQRAQQIKALNKEKSENETTLLEAMERVEALEKEKADLEGQLGAVAERESQIRDRVKGIIDRIDSVESDLSASGGEGS